MEGDFDGLSVLREIQEISLLHYNSEDNVHQHDIYLNKCSVILDKFFKYTFKENYLYSCISYRKDEDSVELYGNKNENGLGYHFNSVVSSEFKSQVNKIFENARDKKSINLTNALLRAKKPFDFYFLFNDSIKPCRDSFWNIDYDKYCCFDYYKFSENVDTFSEINYDKIKRFYGQFIEFQGWDIKKAVIYLHNYYCLGLQYIKDFENKNYILNLIRPSGITEFKYNLLLSLSTNRPLKREEFTIIKLMLYRIVSQTAIEKIKEAEYQNLLTLRSGMGHFLKNRVSSNVNYITKIEHQNVPCNLTIQANCKKLKSTFTSIGHIGSLFHIISSINKNRKTVLGTDLSMDKQWVQKEEIKITDLINDFHNITFSSKASTYLKINITEDSLNNLNVVPYINVKNDKYSPVKWIYRELFYELLVNAGKYSPSENNIFELSIKFNIADNMLILNNKINETNFNSIKTDGRFGECFNKFGKVSITSLNELTGLAFVDEFLNISEMGKLFAKISTVDKNFYIGLILKGLTYKI